MSRLDLVDYQLLTRKTAKYPEAEEGSFGAVAYVTLGLSNEAGEVAGKVKKAWRDDAGRISDERKDAIEGELGDVLWYLARVADELGLNLDEIAKKNVEKLASRAARGVIGGDGDNR